MEETPDMSLDCFGDPPQNHPNMILAILMKTPSVRAINELPSWLPPKPKIRLYLSIAGSNFRLF
jgi:hypothetical protein